ncbi:MAG: GAF domain-containing protein [Chloroflexi bacterium]|nr:GAF domain-containing protein [Chloroflexota bacterium]
MTLSLFTSHRQRQLEALLAISRALTSRLELPSLLRTILAYAAEMVQAEAGFVALTTRDGRLRLAVGYGLPSRVFEALAPYLAQIDVRENLWNEAELRKQLEIASEGSQYPLNQVIALPLMLEDEEVVGGIFLFRSGSRGFTAGDRTLLRDFADQAAIAVRNARQVEQLREAKARVEAIIENSPNGVMILDPHLRVETINRALSDLVGVSPEEARGKRCSEVLKLENVTGEHLCLEQGSPPPPTGIWYGEGDIVRPGHKRVTVGATYSPLFDRYGNLANIIVTLTDITRYREAEELKSTFISVISHELKTPVSLIKGYASTLAREDAPLNKELVRESARIIEEESDRLNELINNLLDASRIQAGALTLDMEPISIVRVARTAIERYRTQTDKHRFLLDFPPDLPLVLGDEKRLRQVFDNLIHNAIKYSPNGGVIRVGARKEDDSVVVFVSDEGIGIPLEEQENIFERFYRIDSSLRRSAQGAGLGLFLVKAIIEAHGGRIWLDSEPDQGTTFYFSLPIDDKAPPASS